MVIVDAGENLFVWFRAHLVEEMSVMVGLFITIRFDTTCQSFLVDSLCFSNALRERLLKHRVDILH